jgi:DNA-binding transcriptional MerR regulator
MGEVPEPGAGGPVQAPQQDQPDRARGVYGISVAAELVGMPAPNLRLYEARGLLDPARTAGGTRRYSADDLDRLRRIGQLLDAGLNLAGIGLVLELEGENARLRAERTASELVAAEQDAEQATAQWQGTERRRRRRRPPTP